MGERLADQSDGRLVRKNSGYYYLLHVTRHVYYRSHLVYEIHTTTPQCLHLVRYLWQAEYRWVVMAQAYDHL